VNLRQLRRIRWAVRATLALGVAASVAANILHAQRNPVSEVIAAWPPLALLLTIELISRLPVHRRSLAAVRLSATAAIAGIAACVSYWHMVGVAAHYGETGPSPYLLPFSVDGLVVVASVSLVELAGRIREAQQPAAAEVGTMVPGGPAERSVPGNGGFATSPSREAEVAAPAASVGLPGTPPATARHRSVPGNLLAAEPWVPGDPGSEGEESSVPGNGSFDPSEGGLEPGKRPRRWRPAAETRRLAAEVQAAEPDLTRRDLAARLDLSPRRLREVLATG
jgi:hypothetical protein